MVKGDPTFNFTTSSTFQARSKEDIFDDTAAAVSFVRDSCPAGSFVRDSWPGLVGAMSGSSIIQFYAGFPEGYPDNDDLVDMSSQPVAETPLPKASNGGATL